AFWVGLLYDDEALDATEGLTRNWSFDEVQELRDAVPTGGLAVNFRGHSLLATAREVLAISRKGLKNRARLNAEGFDETVFLNPLDEVLARGTTSAEEMAKAFDTRWGGSVEPVFHEQAY